MPSIPSGAAWAFTASIWAAVAVAAVRRKGFGIENIDATVLAQRPKLRPYIDEMRRNIASACNLDLDCVSIKATTEEGLGFTGSGEGIAAHAVALLEQAEN